MDKPSKITGIMRFSIENSDAALDAVETKGITNQGEKYPTIGRDKTKDIFQKALIII